MLRYKKTYGFLVAFTLLIIVGCYKDKTVIFETGSAINRPVSFVNDIIPLFNSSCNTSGCHSTGGKAPDLTPTNAYNSLMNGNYVNKENAETSELYAWMTGKRGMPMPVSGINKDHNALILAWIKQGAQNN